MWARNEFLLCLSDYIVKAFVLHQYILDYLLELEFRNEMFDMGTHINSFILKMNSDLFWQKINLFDRLVW